MGNSSHGLEHLLKNYRPSAPPPDLRERCLRPMTAPQRIWPWAAAAAALLAAALGFQTASERTLARSGLKPEPDAAAREWAALTHALGEGPDAEQAATLIVTEQQFLQEAVQPSAPPLEPR